MESKVIVITGASSGIGAALATLLGKEGHRLVLAARREERLQQVADQVDSEALVVKTDVTHRDQVEHLREVALDRFGQVDVWINNAGRGIGRSVLELSDQDIDEMMAVNLKSALFGMQVIVPYFKERQEGHLINISSALSRLPFATYRSAYAAAKAGLNILTADLRVDLAPDYPQIHISLVLPGTVTSEFPAKALGGTPGYQPEVRPPNSQTPEEVAVAIVELIHHPIPELYTNPATKALVQRYYEDPAAFEANLSQPQRPWAPSKADR